MIGSFLLWRDDRPNGPGYVIAENGCHIWVGSRTRGYASYGGKYVSRLRYEREIGPIPEGLVLDHYVCDNGAGGCCNPLHCRPVTQRENILRGNATSSFHAGKSHCLYGHAYSKDNLTNWGLRQGQRKCQTCYRERDRKRKREQRGTPVESYRYR